MKSANTYTDATWKKIIHDDAALEALATKEESIFRESLAEMPPDAGRQFTRDRQYWLNYIERKCGPVARIMHDNEPYTADGMASCLRLEYQNMIDSPQPFIRECDGHRYYTITRQDIRPDRDFIATPQEERSVLASEPDSYTVSLPQLVVTSAQDSRTNAHIRDYAQLGAIEARIAMVNTQENDPYASTDYSSNTDLVVYTDSLLVLDTATFEHGHGAGVAGTGNTSHFYLVKEGRELTAGRVFQSRSQWRTFLSRRAYADLKADGLVSTPPMFDTITSAKQLEKIVAKPRNWRFDIRGLTLLFNYDDLEPGYDKLTTVTIPWNDLRPYLVKDTPILELAQVPVRNPP